MSYCRFSSDNFMSDVYVYEDCMGGWTTHVAGNRLILPPIPCLPISWLIRCDSKVKIDPETRKVIYPNWWRALTSPIGCRLFSWSHRLHLWSVGRWPRRSIELPYAGDRCNDPTPGACADRLEHLRRLGYRVPQRVIDRLREDEKEMRATEGALSGDPAP
jgi:hypothetical protein